MSLDITETFGVKVQYEMDDVGKWRVLPPPPNVLRVLGNVAHRDALEAPGHGPKTQKRRSKRRRLRRLERFQRRTTLRSFGEHEKRERAGG